MRRLTLIAALALSGAALTVASCEDDSLYKQGPSTFQGDMLDGGGGAPAIQDASADGAPTGGASGAAGTAGSDAGP